MNIDRITQQVIERIKQDYYLVERVPQVASPSREREQENIELINMAVRHVTRFYDLDPDYVLSKLRYRTSGCEFTPPLLRAMVVRLCVSVVTRPITHMQFGAAFNRDQSMVPYYNRVFSNVYATDSAYRSDYIAMLKTFKEQME